MNDEAGRPRVMWWLVFIGIVVIVGSVFLRGHTFDSGTTTETQTKKVTKITTRRAPPSDALLLGLLGVGGVFVLCGAFSGRISKLRFPGGWEIEFAEAQKEAAAAVERVVERQTVAEPIDPPSQVAATTLTAVRALEIRRLARNEPAALTSLVSAAKLPFDAKALTNRKQLTREMWDSLAEVALAEVAAKQTTVPSEQE